MDLRHSFGDFAILCETKILVRSNVALSWLVLCRAPHLNAYRSIFGLYIARTLARNFLRSKKKTLGKIRVAVAIRSTRIGKARSDSIGDNRRF